jgi:glycosyltransferase involved in cell wall biosynthesis
MDVVVGRFPPPLGGVSVFVARKFSSLEEGQRGHVDLGDRFWIFRLIGFALRRDSVFLLNTGNAFVFFTFFLLGQLDRTWLYDHNASRHYWGQGLRERFYLMIVSRVKGVRIVHDHLLQTYRDRGVTTPIETEQPFIPPTLSEAKKVVDQYPEAVHDFLDLKGSYKLALSAFKYAIDAQGRDIYGLASLVELLEALRSHHVDVVCLLAVAEWDRGAIPDSLMERIEGLRDGNVLFLMTGQYEFWPIYEHIDCFLRLTSTDGDSVSIREALHFNCKVLASDVVPRPAATISYSYGDSDDLLKKVLRLIASKYR